MRRDWPDNAFTRLFGVRYPIACGPMGGGYSTVALAAEVSEAGGLGSFGAHQLRPDQIDEVIAEIKAATDKPFSVNLWLPQEGDTALRRDPGPLAEHIERVAPYYRELGLTPPDSVGPGPDFDQQVDVVLAAEPAVISFIMGVPPKRVLDEAKRRGILTIGTACTVDEAVALAEAGVAAVVASGSDAGGHRGAFLRPAGESLVGTFSLVPQVADAVSVPVIAAGGVADARGVAAALVLGADGVQIGTGFLVTDVSGVSEVHRKALHSEDARITVLTRLFSGRMARGIANRFTRELASQEDLVPGYPVQGSLTGPLRKAGQDRGIGDVVNLWSGQAAPLTRTRGVRDYMESLVSGVEEILGS